MEDIFPDSSIDVYPLDVGPFTQPVALRSGVWLEPMGSSWNTNTYPLGYYQGEGETDSIFGFYWTGINSQGTFFVQNQYSNEPLVAR